MKLQMNSWYKRRLTGLSNLVNLFLYLFFLSLLPPLIELSLQVIVIVTIDWIAWSTKAQNPSMPKVLLYCSLVLFHWIRQACIYMDWCMLYTIVINEWQVHMWRMIHFAYLLLLLRIVHEDYYYDNKEFSWVEIRMRHSFYHDLIFRTIIFFSIKP